MRADDILPADYATLALALVASLLAYRHAGAKVAGTLLGGLVLLFAVSDRAFVWSLSAGAAACLLALTALQDHWFEGARARLRLR